MKGLAAAVFFGLASISARAGAGAADTAHEKHAPLRGFGGLEGDLGISSGPLLGGPSPSSAVVPGFGIEFGAGPRALPITLGLGAGVWFLDQTTLRGPNALSLTDDGISFGATDVVYRTEIRHVEAVLRLEPDWPWVRPFVSASVGVAALWQTASGGDAATETQQDLAVLRGLTAGCDLEPFGRRSYGDRGTGAFALTIGVRSFQTGDLEYLPQEQPAASGGTSGGGPWHVVAPFVALTMEGWS